MDDLRRGTARAAAYFLLGTVLLVVVPEAAVVWRPELPAPPFWLSVLVLGLACLAQVDSYRRPVPGLLAVALVVLAGPLVVGVTHTGVLLVFGELLYCAVRYPPWRTSRWVIGAAGAALAGFGVLSLLTGGPRAAVFTVLSLSLLLAVPVFWAYEVREQRDRAESERERADALRRMAELDRAAAVAAERNRMARDLHDVIAGQLSAIAIQSEAALTIPDADPTTLRRVLAEVRRGSVASLNEMRTMIGLLRADDDEPRTCPAGLDRIDALLDAGRATGLRVELDDRRPADHDVPPAVDLAAYRIVQESLTNAAKHAPGSAVRLALHHRDGELRMEIDNELVRDAPAGGGNGVGLLGLAERAAAVGGRVEARSRGGSWTVRAVLPVPVP